ncbi:MAG TPA: MBL fold metallo-hydrolase [bacterium]|nr:MBL fold metallo-hydrolase [bacterium]
MADVINIGSSSDGNCFVVNDGNVIFMLDLGFKYDEFQKKYKKQTGKYINALGIDACFVSHRHQDHSRGVESFLENCAEIYAPESMKLPKMGIYGIAPGHSYRDNFLIFAAFPAIHKDLGKNMRGEEERRFGEMTVKIDCLGYVVAVRETGNIWLYLTDTSFILPPLENITHAIIECNHDLDLIDDDDRSELHILRALESHLSLQDVVNILRNSNIKSLRKLYLMHNSRKNLDKKKAKAAIKEIFHGEIYFCKAEGGFDEI